MPVFCISSSTPVSPVAAKSLSFDLEKVKDMSEPPRPCTLLLLNKENAMHSTASLIEAFMVQMSLLNVLADIRSREECDVTSADLFHVAAFTEQLLTQLGGNLSRVRILYRTHVE